MGSSMVELKRDSLGRRIAFVVSCHREVGTGKVQRGRKARISVRMAEVYLELGVPRLAA